MNRFWPKGLRGQLMAAIALALIVAQVIAFGLFARERSQAVRMAYRENVITRTESLLRLLDELPEAQRQRMLDTVSNRLLRFSVDPAPAVEESDADRRIGQLAHDFAQRLGVADDKVRIALLDPDGDLFDWQMNPQHMHDAHDDAHRPWRRPRWIAFAVARADGTWLNAVATTPPPPPPFGRAFLLSLLLSLAAVLAAAYWLARRLTSPIVALASSARGFGAGSAAQPLAPDGPQEVRETIDAFNDMQARIARFIKDRTHLLAAVSHDLRTPLTSMRLRAELIEDEEARSKLIESIEEMQNIANDTLEFVRAEQTSEELRETDLQSLAQSVADDLAELGHDVSVKDGGRVLVRCQPVALRRALRNLMINAAIYGKRAQVAIEQGPQSVRLVIDDEGPGLPDGDLERMFDPFTRGESSRSRNTGGAGMGLPIARTILRRLGGDVTLESREGGGLRALVALPSLASSN